MEKILSSIRRDRLTWVVRVVDQNLLCILDCLLKLLVVIQVLNYVRCCTDTYQHRIKEISLFGLEVHSRLRWIGTHL